MGAMQRRREPTEPDSRPRETDSAPASQGNPWGIPWLRRLSVIAGLAVVGWLVSVAATTVARGGLRPCDRLDERLCRDLGPSDCDLWKKRLGGTGAASTQPYEVHGHRAGLFQLALHVVLPWNIKKADNPLCHDELGADLYPTILGAVREIVAKERAREDLAPK
jgi:hypothetical protein